MWPFETNELVPYMFLRTVVLEKHLTNFMVSESVYRVKGIGVLCFNSASPFTESCMICTFKFSCDGVVFQLSINNKSNEVCICAVAKLVSWLEKPL